MRPRLGSLTLFLVSAALLAGCGDDDFGEVTVEPAPDASEERGGQAAPDGEGEATPDGAGRNEATPDGAGRNEAAPDGAEGTEGGGAPRVSEENLRPRVEACDAAGVRTRGGLLAIRVDCGTARRIASRWSARPACAPSGGSARSSCTIDGFRCLSNAVGRGVEVTCSRSERTVGFIAPRS